MPLKSLALLLRVALMTLDFDLIFKVISIGVLPLCGWVWKTNTHVTTLELKLEYADREIAKLGTSSAKASDLAKDIEYIKETIGDLKEMIGRLQEQRS